MSTELAIPRAKSLERWATRRGQVDGQEAVRIAVELVDELRSRSLPE